MQGLKQAVPTILRAMVILIPTATKQPTMRIAIMTIKRHIQVTTTAAKLSANLTNQQQPDRDIQHPSIWSTTFFPFIKTEIPNFESLKWSILSA